MSGKHEFLLKCQGNLHFPVCILNDEKQEMARAVP